MVPNSGAATHHVSAPHARALGAEAAAPAQESDRITKASSSEPVSVSPHRPNSRPCEVADSGCRVRAATASPLMMVAVTKTRRRWPDQSASVPSTIGAPKRTADANPPSSPRWCVSNPLDSNHRNVYGVKAASAMKRRANTTDATGMRRRKGCAAAVSSVAVIAILGSAGIGGFFTPPWPIVHIYKI
eukprot:scaffold11043_cov111-Isochrysis_galbana.AAC.3